MWSVTAERLSTLSSIRLRRRGGDDLTLTRADQSERDATVIDFTSRLLAGLARAGASEAIREILPDALPWSTFLPEEDIDQMLAEFIEVAQGVASLRNLAPMAGLLEQWRQHRDRTAPYRRGFACGFCRWTMVGLTHGENDLQHRSEHRRLHRRCR